MTGFFHIVAGNPQVGFVAGRAVTTRHRIARACSTLRFTRWVLVMCCALSGWLLHPARSEAAANSSVTFPFGETFRLRIPAEVGEPQEVVAAHDGILVILNAPEGIFRPGTTFATLSGLKAGATELTFIGSEGSATIRVVVSMSTDEIEALIIKHFPEANVQLTSGGEKLLIVEGDVSSPAEIEPILGLLHRLVGPENVVNALRVRGVMQVQLEVVFARVDRTQLRQLGFNFLNSETPWYVGSQIGQLVNAPPVAIRGGAAPTVGGSRVFQNVGGAATAALNPESSIFFGLTQEARAFFGYLEALQDKGVVKVLATPTLVTLSGRPAEFLAGGEQPFPTAQGVVQTPQVEFKKFGTRLNFLPVVLGGGKIRLELVPEVSTVNFGAAVDVGGITVPQIVTQKLHATVEMMDGETLILGGIIQSEKDSRVASIPVLGSIPIAGALFRRVKDFHRETELLVLVTPRLVMPLDDKPCMYPGSETRDPTDKELYLGGHLELPPGHGVGRAELMPRSIDFPQIPYHSPELEPLPLGGGVLRPGPELAPPVEEGSLDDTSARRWPARPGEGLLGRRLQPVTPTPLWDPNRSPEASRRVQTAGTVPEGSPRVEGTAIIRTRGR